MRLLANTLQMGDILRKYFSRKLIASNKMWATALYVGQQTGLCNYRTITHVLLLKCHSLLTRRYVYLLFHGCIGMLKMLTVLILFTFFKPTREASSISLTWRISKDMFATPWQRIVASSGMMRQKISSLLMILLPPLSLSLSWRPWRMWAQDHCQWFYV